MARAAMTGTKLEAAIGAEIRRQRKKQDMTVAALAEAAGLSQSMLSKIETGQTSPSLTTLASVAEALAVPVSSFFSAGERSRDVSYVPAGEGIRIDRRGTRVGHIYQLLGHSVRGPLEVDPYLITLDEGSEPYDEFKHEGMEFIHVLQGRMVYRHGDRSFTLDPGDSLFFDAMSPHGPAELLELPAIYLSIISNAERSDES
ncbi:helix-turn-helix transcriptional regulator [Marivibrio halodurans]|uniref:Helix-turn-helix transcriptional regulator n=2 Tax=Marivibrio halodurans TaxID=2039722 RepID=A0A8J7V465_9PROT|nr:helix-turn-helix transcriptional regulator [Marivibrio halodurans]